MSNEEIFDFWQAARRINPSITLAQASALARRLLAQKRASARRGPTS